MADLTGICNLGRFAFRRSADVVSSLRRAGTLGRRGGAGRENPSWDGAGDGAVWSDGSRHEVMADGIMGFGETAENSSSGRSRGRPVTEMSRWKSPPGLPIDFWALLGGWSEWVA